MKDATDVLFVLDRSGSMANIWSDTVGGFNTFIEEQKKLPGECRLTLLVFDMEFDVIFDRAYIHGITGLPEHVVPRGGTALNDAVARGIATLGGALAALSEEERPSNVLCAISTDGHENSSREVTTTELKERIREQTEQWNWHFVYMGVGPDAFDDAVALGIGPAHTIAFTTAAAFSLGNTDALSRATSNLRRTGSTGQWKPKQ